MSSEALDSSPALPEKLSRTRVLTRTIAAFAAVAMALGIALASNQAAAAPKPVVVKMSDEPARYLPSPVTVKVGQPVQWINTGQVVHTVTLVPEDVQDPKDVSMPKGAETFDSGFMAPGATFTHTFKIPGTYRYFCIPHEKAGMVGEVVVKK
jgi:plastocyanin